MTISDGQWPMGDGLWALDDARKREREREAEGGRQRERGGERGSE